MIALIRTWNRIKGLVIVALDGNKVCRRLRLFHTDSSGTDCIVSLEDKLHAETIEFDRTYLYSGMIQIYRIF